MKHGYHLLDALPSRARFRRLPSHYGIYRSVTLSDGREFDFYSWDAVFPQEPEPWHLKDLTLDQYRELVSKWEIQKARYQAAWDAEDRIYKSERRNRWRLRKHQEFFDKEAKRLNEIRTLLELLSRYCTPKRWEQMSGFLRNKYLVRPTDRTLPHMSISTNTLIRSIYEDVYRPLLDGKLKVDRARVAIQAMQQICHMAELQLAYEASRRAGRDITVDMLENR